MIVYRITTEKWSKSLGASGYAARWNAKGSFIIYTAESRSLACLENMVHRSGEGDTALYKVMLIEIPDKVEITKITTGTLKKNWYAIENYPYCQAIGAKWLTDLKTAVLQVPSAVIKKESNYLINPNHPNFKKIKLKTTEGFDFDPRV